MFCQPELYLRNFVKKKKKERKKMYIAVSLNKNGEKKQKKTSKKKKNAFIGVFSLKELLARLCFLHCGLYVYKSVYTLFISPLFPPDTGFSNAFHL